MNSRQRRKLERALKRASIKPEMVHGRPRYILNRLAHRTRRGNQHIDGTNATIMHVTEFRSVTQPASAELDTGTAHTVTVAL